MEHTCNQVGVHVTHPINVISEDCWSQVVSFVLLKGYVYVINTESPLPSNLLVH